MSNRPRLSVVVLLGAAALSLSACGSSEEPAPAAGAAGAEATTSPATTAATDDAGADGADDQVVDPAEPGTTYTATCGTDNPCEVELTFTDVSPIETCTDGSNPFAGSEDPAGTEMTAIWIEGDSHVVQATNSGAFALGTVTAQTPAGDLEIDEAPGCGKSPVEGIKVQDVQFEGEQNHFRGEYLVPRDATSVTFTAYRADSFVFPLNS